MCFVAIMSGIGLCRGGLGWPGGRHGTGHPGEWHRAIGQGGKDKHQADH
ncbi:hypothetical protein SAMN05880593_13029 [Rhizobium sp. RU36D]|nr:hypothetical protein SAMN05880593_13029 [Rhizobium sp. RU36D]